MTAVAERLTPRTRAAQQELPARAQTNAGSVLGPNDEGPPPVHPAEQTAPEGELQSIVSPAASSAPVSAQSSLRPSPVQAPQLPQPQEQSAGGVPGIQAEAGLTRGEQSKLSPPARAAQHASSAPQPALLVHQQSPGHIPVSNDPGESSAFQQCLPGNAKQQAESAAPPSPPPAIPMRRVPLPKLPRMPKPAGPILRFPQHVSLSTRYAVIMRRSCLPAACSWLECHQPNIRSRGGGACD